MGNIVHNWGVLSIVWLLTLIGKFVKYRGIGENVLNHLSHSHTFVKQVLDRFFI